MFYIVATDLTRLRDVCPGLDRYAQTRATRRLKPDADPEPDPDPKCRSYRPVSHPDAEVASVNKDGIPLPLLVSTLQSIPLAQQCVIRECLPLDTNGHKSPSFCSVYWPAIKTTVFATGDWRLSTGARAWSSRPWAWPGLAEALLAGFNSWP